MTDRSISVHIFSAWPSDSMAVPSSSRASDAAAVDWRCSIRSKALSASLSVEATKQHADGQGEETEQPLDELIDIALFSDDPENLLAEDFVIYSQKHQIVSGTNTIELKVKEKPVYAGVDPYIKLVDKDSKNNLAKF